MRTKDQRGIAERYVGLCERLIERYQTVAPFSFSFYKPWWRVLLKQPLHWGFVFFSVCVFNGFLASLPLLIGQVLATEQFIYFVYLLAVWLCIEVMQSCATVVYCFAEVRLMQSVQYQSYHELMLVDPINHVTKPRGKMFAKVERAVRSYENVIDDFLWELAPILISIITVVGSFFTFDTTLGFIALSALAGIITINLIGIMCNVYMFEHRAIVADDTAKTVIMEGLLQVPLIRSAFATNSWIQKGASVIRNVIANQSMTWVAYVLVNFVTRFIYWTSIIGLGWYLMQSIQSGHFSVVLATTFLVAYINATQRIHRVGRMVQKIMQSAVRIKDLFSFVRMFGKKTFPVLPGEGVAYVVPRLEERSHVDITMTHMNFSYELQAHIFQDHDLHFSIPCEQACKLYGIIGPSGSGKTTFLSILGGQLHPDQGRVTINTIPVYEVDDMVRRQIIALQGQTATGVSGTVRENLALGFPNHCSDSLMIDVLKRVGLWNILSARAGLDTEVGESGLTLSVGQRQRLNFAGLYLRVKEYKPLVVLIDEPTSSLDQVSERAITGMIDEIAQSALTMVIAHRLNTLTQAVGILDCSLIGQEKVLRFYAPSELEERSDYYRKLMRGEITLDE